MSLSEYWIDRRPWGGVEMAQMQPRIDYCGRICAMDQDLFTRMETLLAELTAPVVVYAEKVINCAYNNEANMALQRAKEACEAALLSHPLWAEWCAFIDANRTELMTLPEQKSYYSAQGAAWRADVDARSEASRSANSADEKGYR